MLSNLKLRYQQKLAQIAQKVQNNKNGASEEGSPSKKTQNKFFRRASLFVRSAKDDDLQGDGVPTMLDKSQGMEEAVMQVKSQEKTNPIKRSKSQMPRSPSRMGDFDSAGLLIKLTQGREDPAQRVAPLKRESLNDQQIVTMTNERRPNNAQRRNSFCIEDLIQAEDESPTPHINFHDVDQREDELPVKNESPNEGTELKLSKNRSSKRLLLINDVVVTGEADLQKLESPQVLVAQPDLQHFFPRDKNLLSPQDIKIKGRPQVVQPFMFGLSPLQSDSFLSPSQNEASQFIQRGFRKGTDGNSILGRLSDVGNSLPSQIDALDGLPNDYLEQRGRQQSDLSLLKTNYNRGSESAFLQNQRSSGYKNQDISDFGTESYSNVQRTTSQQHDTKNGRVSLQQPSIAQLEEGIPFQFGNMPNQGLSQYGNVLSEKKGNNKGLSLFAQNRSDDGYQLLRLHELINNDWKEGEDELQLRRKESDNEAAQLELDKFLLENQSPPSIMKHFENTPSEQTPMSLQTSPNSLRKTIGLQPKCKVQQEEVFDDIHSERSEIADSESCDETQTPQQQSEFNITPLLANRDGILPAIQEECERIPEFQKQDDAADVDEDTEEHQNRHRIIYVPPCKEKRKNNFSDARLTESPSAFPLTTKSALTPEAFGTFGSSPLLKGKVAQANATPDNAQNMGMKRGISDLMNKRKTSYTLIQEFKKNQRQQSQLGGDHSISEKSNTQQPTIDQQDNLPPQECSLIKLIGNNPDKDESFKPAFRQETHSHLFHNDCTCNFDTLLKLSECQSHPSRTSENISGLRVPNTVLKPEECTILRQGWVKKKTTNLFLGFQERYLVLYSNKKLVYYKLLKNKAVKYKNHWQIQSEDPSASTLSYSIAQIQEDFHKSGEFDLNLIAVNRISLSGPSRFELTFTGMLRQFLFQATSTQDAFDWKHTIETIANQIHIPEAMNRQSSLAVQSQNSSSLQNTFQVVPTPQSLSEMKMNIPVQRNFWKYARLCEEDFQKVADTGDIILFKAPDFACKMQRFITNSNYNHIAMILRSSTGSLKFIEATMQQGVEIIDWEIFVHYKCYRHFERVVYRRVGNFQRSKETLTKLEEFIKVAKNKRYSLAATKLLRKHCTNDSDISIKEDKTYFCSELVASLYKNMGLLPPDISASQYWPVNFSSRAGMKLLGGAFLDEEKLLEFNSVISGEGGNA